MRGSRHQDARDARTTLRHRTATAFVLGTALLAVLLAATVAQAWTPVPVKDDRNVFMPGSQQGSANLESQGRCDNCHGGYDQAVEPAFNQYGSMMAQAARDPLWLACLTVANQDSVWAVGNPNAGDLCIRCHTPPGWLGGRSDPTNTSKLTGTDFEGVSCDSCHTMVDPLAQLSQPGVPPETVPGVISLAEATQTQDFTVLGALKLFDGTNFLNGTTKLPTYYGNGSLPNYVEGAGGQYFIDTGNAKRGPFHDHTARHQVYYSRYHKSRTFCATCHDVSNPILANVLIAPGTPERQAAGSYFHVERTYSEFALSAYGRGSGATTTVHGIGTADKCQDCHLRNVTGKGANKSDAPLRTDLPLHDQTGGNTWMSGILASVATGTAFHDPYNLAILSGAKYPGAKIDVAGLQSVPNELKAGQQRALQMLREAATVTTQAENASSLTLRVRNNTGHKLISGFPEGRRMFLYVTFYDAAGRLLDEVNRYEPLKTAKDGQGNDTFVSGAEFVSRTEPLIWETQMSSALTGEQKTFHFALATDRYKDNRIPPKGFDTNGMNARLAQPKWAGADAPGLFTVEEYTGGWDDLTLAKPAGAASWYATLYYQTTSKEYIEFLRDQVNGAKAPGSGSDFPTLTSPAPSGESQAYIVQSDPFFANLKDWGKAIWDLWLHNEGAAPVVMTELGTAPRQSHMAAPDLTVQRIAKRAGGWLLDWSWMNGAAGYRVYRIGADGARTLVADQEETYLRLPGTSSGQEYAVRAYRQRPDGPEVLSAESAPVRADY